MSYYSGRFHSVKCRGQSEINVTLKKHNVFPTNTKLRATVNIFLHVHVAVTLYIKYKNTY